MAHRISKGGSFRIDLRFRGVGRIALASRTTDKQTLRKLNAMLTELHEDGHLDILKGIKERRWSLQQVYQAKRAGRLSYVASELVLDESLWAAVREWIPRSAATAATRKRYQVSFRALERAGVLGPSATVAELRAADWHGLKTAWHAGPADWNRLRAAVSRFLSITMGDKFHPFRREVMGSFPRAKEPQGRVPDLTPELFWDIIAAAPTHLQPAFVTIAALGLRVGEYLALEDHHLLHSIRGVKVPGTKTAGSDDTILVGARAWNWVRTAVPSPVRYKWLYTQWKRACEAVGVADVRLHDLRHSYGQWLTEGGRPEVSVQHGLRHADPKMTRRYTRQKDRGENAKLMDEILFPERSASTQKGA